MSNNDIDRKIAVIFATDVVGYSKHMEKDENATLTSLNACNKIIEPLIKKQKGRIFNTGGDSVFALYQEKYLQLIQQLHFHLLLKQGHKKYQNS